jgi:hypothetical protein
VWCAPAQHILSKSLGKKEKKEKGEKKGFRTFLRYFEKKRKKGKNEVFKQILGKKTNYVCERTKRTKKHLNNKFSSILRCKNDRFKAKNEVFGGF